MLEAQAEPEAVADLPTGSVTVSTITDPAEFAALESQWNRLVVDAGITHPFARHEWLSAWWDCFSGDNRLHVVVAHRGDRLVGAAPLMANSMRQYGLSARRLQFVYNVHTPRLDVLVAADEPAAWDAIWSHIAGRDDWDVLELNQLAEGCPTLTEVGGRARDDGFNVATWSSGRAPYIPLEGSWEDYFDGLKSKHRSNLRNRMKRLRKIGPVEIETITEPGEDLEEALRDALRIEAAGWKGDEGTAIRCDDDIHDFYSLIAHVAAERGMLRLQSLRVDGERIAFAYSLCHANTLFLLKTGYDPEFSKYSPFNVLLREILHECFDRGLREFDFLGVFDRWKESWAEHGRAHQWLYVFSGSATSRLIHGAKFGVVPKVKEMLGGDDSDSGC